MTKPLFVQIGRLPFRLLVREYGCDLAYTPMIMAESFLQSEKARHNEFTTCEEDRPLIVQFASKNPLEFATVTRMISETADGVDLNCGCPQRWAMQEGYGSAMLRYPDLISEMIRTARSTIRSSNNPSMALSIKIRICSSGLKDTIELCRRAEKSGCDWITLHARTPSQRGEPADWSSVRDVVQSVQCPVVLNGDVTSLEDADRAHNETGCLGVMSARGLMENPALFSGSGITPSHCVKKWVHLCAKHGHPFTLFHRQTACMIESQLSKSDWLLFQSLSSHSAVCDFINDYFT